MPMQSFLPALPPSVVPPRISAPYPCTFPHSAVYEHPTRPTVVTFTVTAQGRVTNASIVQSSGSGVVDEVVRECASGFIYAPAMRDGAPIDVSWAWEYNLTITGFRAPPALPPDAPQGTKFVMMPVEIYRSGVARGVGCESWHQNAPRGVLVAFDVEPDGSVKNASVVQGSGDSAVDKDAVDCVSRRAYKPATRDGEPVGMRLTAELFGPNGE
jgi:TonB family protein